METNQHRIAAAILALLALCFFAPSAHAHSPRARELSITIQSIQPETRTLLVVPANEVKPREYVWTKSTVFLKNHRVVDASALKVGVGAKIYYHTPFFGKPYVSQVVWLTENSPPKKT